ncbi:Collagen alpha-1(VI) chain [Metarhizium anisopliae]
MLELSSVLALSGLLALASAQGPAADFNSVCMPSGQLKNTIPYPCPGIARAKDACSKFLPGPGASPDQIKKHRDCLCFDEKIIQFEKGCTACKKTHAFLSKRGEGYWNGILDRVYSGYCQAETPTAAYDASWASASQAAGPYPTGGPDDVLINYAKDLPADDKTKVELYWKGTTEERRPSATAAPTSVSTSAAATPTLVDDDDEWCDDEETTSASAGSAAATTASPNTAVSGSIQPTPVLNNDWISASCKQDPSASTVHPPQPSQSGLTKQNETSPAPATETVYVDRVIILMVCQKCVYAKSDNGDYQLACASPMEVEGTKKQVPVEEAKHLPAVPVALPKEPVSVEQKKKIVVPDTIIQQVCGCSYTSGPGSNGNGANGSNPGSSKNPGSGSDSPKNNGPTGSNGSNGPNGSGNEGPNGSNGKPGSGNNGANGSNGSNGSTGSPSGPGNNGANGSNGPNGSTGSPSGSGNNGSNGPNGSTGSGPDSPKNNGSNGPNGSTGSPSGSGNEGANGSNGKPGSGNNGANGSNPGSPNAPGSGNTGAGSDAGRPKNPGSNGSNGPNNAGSNGVAAPTGSNPSKPTRVGSAGLPSGTNQVPIVSSASGNMPASVAMLFLAAMAILI